MVAQKSYKKLHRMWLTDLREYMTQAAKTSSISGIAEIPRLHRCLDVGG
jgi:hypothetical protein